ncbi:MAG TPA: Hsp20/alpha crystallin family protein [Ignavibacteria bacterium]|nr:Hsp20/alpha crystallin family protein [Ignavibacteria bacterium]
MALVKWNSGRELLDVERELDRLFNSFGKRFGFNDNDVNEEYENAVWMPLTDIVETDNNYSLHLDLPGIKKDDVKISYSDGQLSISGERKQEKETKNAKYHRLERAFGKYYRTFTLPKQIMEDKIDAEFKDGQLMINIPKAEEAKPKEIPIKVK